MFRFWYIKQYVKAYFSFPELPLYFSGFRSVGTHMVPRATAALERDE